MTPEVFADFSICLQFLPNGTAPAWNTDAARFYFAALGDIPDADAGKLMKAVATEFTFRPTPHDILALWRKAKATNTRNPDAVVAEIYRLRDQFGEYAVMERIVDADTDRVTVLRKAGEPTWTDDVKRRIVAAMGGWVNFCRDEAPASVQRGQLLKITQMVLGNEGDGAIERLRLEYREQVAALPRPEADPPVNLLPLDGPAETNGLTRMGSLSLPTRGANGKH